MTKKIKEQTTRYTPNIDPFQRSSYIPSFDIFVDFPWVEDPEEYKTHKNLESKKIREQAPEEKTPPTPAPEIAGADAGGDIDIGAGTDIGAAGDLGGGLGGLGGGFGTEEPNQELTSDEIGRVYELKKIYTRLMSLESYLSSSTDVDLIKMRNIIGQAIELFEIIIINFKQYKDKIDDIIIVFYKFLDQAFLILRDYYKKNAVEE